MQKTRKGQTGAVKVKTLEIWASNVSHGVLGMIKWVNPCNVFVAEPGTEQRLLYKLLFLFRGLWIKKRIY